MPPTKDSAGSKNQYSRSFSSGSSGTSIAARVYHPATNLMPHSPTGVAPSFSAPRANGNTSTWGRQNSYNGKYS